VRTWFAGKLTSPGRYSCLPWTSARRDTARKPQPAFGRQEGRWLGVESLRSGSGEGGRQGSRERFAIHGRLACRPDGEKLLRSDFNPTTSESGIYVRKGGGWKALYEAKDCGRLTILGWNADTTAALVSGVACGTDRKKVWSLPLDGSAMTILVEDPQSDAGGAIYDAFDGRPLAISMSGSEVPMRWLDAQAERRYASLKRTFGSPEVYIYGRSADAKRVVVYAEKPGQAPVYYLVDYVAKTADILNEAYPLLEG
jgi:hypothetical protein